MSEHDNNDGNTAEQTNANASESSTDKEQDDVQAQLQKKEEEIERLKSHLRNKETKQKEQTTQETSEELEMLKEVKAKLERQEASAKELAFNKALQTEWGKGYSVENDPEGKQLAELNDALALVNKKYPVLSAEDYERNIRKAHLIISDDVDNVTDDSAKETQQRMKAEATGTTGSSRRRSDVDHDAKLSSEELRFRESFRSANNIKE